MENKNKIVWVGISGIILGFIVAWFYFGNFSMGGQNMNNTMDNMMSGIDGKIGDSFDKAFIDEMTIHHQGAIVMAEEALKVSKRSEILKLANDIISAQNSEITQMASWKANWFK